MFLKQPTVEPEVKISPRVSYREELTVDGERLRIYRIGDLDVDLRVRMDKNNNPITFEWDLFSLSDTHLGSRHCRAKQLSHFLQWNKAKKVLLLGDIIDGGRMLEKKQRNVAGWHRRVISQILEIAAGETEVIYLDGNHEEGMRASHTIYKGDYWVSRDGFRALLRGMSYKTRTLIGQVFMGMKISEELEHTNVVERDGKKIQETLLGDHGVKWEKIPLVFYFLGDKINNFFGLVDDICVIPLIQPVLKTKFTVAAFAKRKTKEWLKKHMGAIGRIGAALDNIEGAVYHLSGHTHIQGYDWSPEGKLIVNGGSSTGSTCAQFYAEIDGEKLLGEWHLDGLKLIQIPHTKDGPHREAYATWEELGLKALKASPIHVHDAIPDRNKDYIPMQLKNFAFAAPRLGFREAWKACCGKQMPKPETIYEDENVLKTYRVLRLIDHKWACKKHKQQVKALRKQTERYNDKAVSRMDLALARKDITDSQYQDFLDQREASFAALAKLVTRRNNPELPDRNMPARAARRDAAEKRKAAARIKESAVPEFA